MRIQANIRKKMTGRKFSEEHKAKLRAKALARNMSGERHPMYGKHHTEESIEAMRQAHLGNSSRKDIPCSEETKAILREKTLARHAAKRAAQETP